MKLFLYNFHYDVSDIESSSHILVVQADYEKDAKLIAENWLEKEIADYFWYVKSDDPYLEEKILNAKKDMKMEQIIPTDLPITTVLISKTTG